MYKFSDRSLSKLEGVHPDLVKVCNRAIQISPYDFGIIDGVRDIETQKKYVAEGKSQTMDSKHLIQDDGYSHAIDFAVYVDCKITWEIGYYRKVVQAFFTAAIELGVQIEAGCLWKNFIDGVHLQLNSKYY
jgi:peptidoglycan LD-endopeptidase CwlK